MKNIHLYHNQTDYDNVKNKLILPTVSFIEENNHVEYNPHHEYVEIAGIKWATMNVGASGVTDTGLYFQWGDTKGYTASQVGKKEDGKKYFARDNSDYKWYDTSKNTFTKYYSGDKKMVLDLEDDAVNAAWGGFWRMPKKEELDKLKSAVTATFTSKNGVNGLLCTPIDKNNKDVLFFPACGYAGNGSINNAGSNGSYWLSSFNGYDDNRASFLDFTADQVKWHNDLGRRMGGCTVRGVLDEK